MERTGILICLNPVPAVYAFIPWKKEISFFFSFPAAAAKLLQSCPTLCNPRDGSLPGSPVPGILQAKTLEWVAISFSKAWKWKVKMKSLSRVRLLATPWTAAHQAPPSMGFSRLEYWSGVPLPSLELVVRRQILLTIAYLTWNNWPEWTKKIILCGCKCP